MKFPKQINLILFFLLSLFVGVLDATGLQAYFADFTNPASLSDINSANAAVTVPPAYASCNFTPPNVVFGVGFTSGLAYRNSTLYGLEFEGGNGTTVYLYSFSTGPCATGTRLQMSSPVGQQNLESLAYCEADGFFYSVDFDFGSPHLGQLVRINPATGIGTLIGSHMAADVRIVGMVCDPMGQLWAVSSGFGGPGGRNVELLTINRSTGVETLVGQLGLPANEVEAMAIDPDLPEQLFAVGKSLYQVNKSSGAASLIGGPFTQFWAMAGIPGPSDIIFKDGFETNGN